MSSSVESNNIVGETVKKEKKPYKSSVWQEHLLKVIDKNKGKGLKLPELTRMASQTYNKVAKPVKAQKAPSNKKT